MKIAIGIAIATAALVSCSKENQAVSQTGITTFEATADALGGKAQLAYRYDVLWQTTDEIAVKDNGGVSSVFKLKSGEGTTEGTFELKTGTAPQGAIKAFYPAGLVDASGLVWPEEQSGTVVPMYAESASVEGDVKLGFSSLGAMLRVFFSTPVADVKLKSITLTTLGASPALLSGAFTVEDGKAVITAGGKNTIDLKLPEGGVAVGTSAKTFDFAIPAGTYADGFELVFETVDGAICRMTSSQPFAIERNSVNVLVLNGTKFQSPKPDDAINGLFTVNAQGKQVYFAKGNLKYDVNKAEWGFFDKQYEYQKAYSTDLISLFTWGLGEWSTDPAAESYAGSDAAFVDWGTVIDDKGTWRTLTKEEWMYVLWTRAGDAYDNKVCWSGVKVGDAENCFVIAPDGNQVEIKTSYTAQEWAEAEAAGFVCLPNGGYRGKGTIDFSYGGYYWASNQKVDNTGNCVNFKSTAKSWDTSTGLGKQYPASVRLVADK